MANAGIATYGSVLKVDPEAFRTLVDVNVVGVFNTVRAALPSVIERRGYVLIVSSAAAFAASPGLAPYDASKAGVEHFANALRLEVAHRGVDVGSAHMLWIDTPLVQEAKADLRSFREMLEACRVRWARPRRSRSAARRSSRASRAASASIYCPGWVGLCGGSSRCWPRAFGESPTAEGRSGTAAADGRRSRGAGPLD